jgi:hypothetical protein
MAQARAAIRQQLGDRERDEYDNITWVFQEATRAQAAALRTVAKHHRSSRVRRADAITAMTDPLKLQRLEQYLREEGFEPTAKSVQKRLQELGHAQPAQPDARRLLAEEIKSFVSSAQARSSAMHIDRPRVAVPIENRR